LRLTASVRKRGPGEQAIYWLYPGKMAFSGLVFEKMK